jgi:hypothetical protein
MKRTALIATAAALALAGCGGTSHVPTAPSAQQQLRQLDRSIREAYAAKDWGKLCSYISTAARARVAQHNHGMSCEQVVTAAAATYPLPTPAALTSIKVNGSRATFIYADGSTSPAVLEDSWKTDN